MGITPCALADDLLLIVTGDSDQDSDDDDMLNTLSFAEETTLEFNSDMGGRPSPGKSTIVVSAANHRAHLRGRRWGDSNSNIPAKHNMRDLGVHLTLAKRQQGPP